LQTAENSKPGLDWPWHLLVFLVAGTAVLSRRPSLFLHPEFYAEDGSVWYAQAYNWGWLHSLIVPDGGYLNTLPRLVAGLCLLGPLRFAPLLMNVVGLIIQVLPVTVLISARCSSWWSLRVRFLQAIAYLALPNCSEIHVVLTNAQWHLALLACLLAFAEPPPTSKWAIFDVIVLTLCSFTGPFVIVLLPFIVIFWLKRRYSWSLVLIAILCVGAAIQLVELLVHPNGSIRPGGSLGATPLLFARLVAGQVFVAGLLGHNGFDLSASALSVWVIAAAGIGVLIYCACKAHLELRLFIGFCLAVFAASLTNPLIAGNAPSWPLLALYPGGRYWFFPILAFVWSLLWLATRSNRATLRRVAVACLVVTCWGIKRDWVYPPFSDVHFSESVKRFQAAEPGTEVRIAVYPEDFPPMVIKKRADSPRP
jgi:hypothetical protein